MPTGGDPMNTEATDNPPPRGLQHAIDAAQQRHRRNRNREVGRREQAVLDGVVAEAEVLTHADAAAHRGHAREGQ